MPSYTVQRATTRPALRGEWDGPAWHSVPALEITHFHERGSDHRPVTRVKVLYDDQGLYVFFQVQDRYVRCVHTEYNSSVCRDSCAEFFVEPVAGRGYFNFEINCGGTMLLYYITQSASIKYDPVHVDLPRLEKVKIHASMPKVVDPEITEPVTWTLEYFVPFELFESYVGSLPPVPGSIWRANFYKCGDQTSHPHWGMWSEVHGKLSFHKPEFFAPLYFAK